MTTGRQRKIPAHLPLMPSPHTQIDPESVRRKVEALIKNFQTELQSGKLRPKILALVPIFKSLRSLSKSLIPAQDVSSARERIGYYFRKHARTVISGDELSVVSGIQDYPRRVRELRVQFGWAIASGMTIKQISEEENNEVPPEMQHMKASEYVLLNEKQDRDAAHRWHLANTIRRERLSAKDKILKYLQANIGRAVTGEELRYITVNKGEWPRRVRELRTEEGWPISTRMTGRPDLPIGTYVLQADRQIAEHDRYIKDEIRREVLRRDGYKCKECGWSHKEWDPSDPRHLELHHITHHARGGQNVEANLRSLCNVCHDRTHRMARKIT